MTGAGAGEGADRPVDELAGSQGPAGVDGDNELEQLLGELGPSASDYRIRIDRVHANQDPEECIDCPLPTFSKEQLRADYGPGHYKVEVRKGGKIRRRWDWRFARPLTPASSSTSTERGTRERELEAELATARAREADRTQQILLALIQRDGGSKGLEPLQVLQLLGQAKDLIGGGAGGGPKETLGLVRELLELREELGGGADRETTAADVVRVGLDRLPQLTELLRAAAALPDPKPAAAGDTSRSRSVTPKALPTAPASSSTSTSSTPAPSSRGDPAMLSQLVPMILKLAQSGMTAAAAAELITPKLDALDDEQFGFLATLILHAQCVPMVVRAEPRLAPISAWLEEVAGELRAFITRETSDAPLPSAAQSSDAARASTEGPHDPAPRGGRATKSSTRGAAKR